MLLMNNSDQTSELRNSPFDECRIYPWPTISGALSDIARNPRSKVAYFYRHAATEFNELNLISGQTDINLSDKGLRQARQLRESIPSHFDIVFCSRLKRTWQTMHAALQSEQTNQLFYVDKRLDEVSLGDYEGQKRRYIEAFARGDIDFIPPGGGNRTARQHNEPFRFILT